MGHKGFSHIGLSTLDLDKTRQFYHGVLGFKLVIADTIKIKEGGRIRHMFFDTGRDQLLAFMEAQGISDVPAEYDAGINRGLGVPASFYHFAFEAGSEAGLSAKRDELQAKGAISSITAWPSPSSSKIPTGCRSNIAASCANSPTMMRPCKNVSR